MSIGTLNRMGLLRHILLKIYKIFAKYCIEIGIFKITVTPAYHSDPFSVGCLMKTGDKTVYYSGDTLLSDTLFEDINTLKTRPIDIFFIIINGRLGNMNVQEAIELTSKLKPKLAILMHYGMFVENTEAPSVFIEGCHQKNINARELKLGKETEL